MVNREFLARMRPGSLLINTSRGGLVVESDLRDSLVSGHLAGAGLDVLNHEPPEPGNPLLGLPNVILSPHVAGTDYQSMSDMAELAARMYRRSPPQSMAGRMRRQPGAEGRLAMVNGGRTGRRSTIALRAVAIDQTWNDDPQPQLFTTLGLLKTNPRFSSPS